MLQTQLWHWDERRVLGELPAAMCEVAQAAAATLLRCSGWLLSHSSARSRPASAATVNSLAPFCKLVFSALSGSNLGAGEVRASVLLPAFGVGAERQGSNTYSPQRASMSVTPSSPAYTWVPGLAATGRTEEEGGMCLLRSAGGSDAKGQAFTRPIVRLELQCWCPKSTTFLWDYRRLKEPYFLFLCKAVKIHACTNTYPGWGWSETLTLTFLQAGVRLRHRLTRVQPGTVYDSAAARRGWARGSQPLRLSSGARQCWSTYCPAAERVHEGGKGLHLPFLSRMPWHHETPHSAAACQGVA